MSWQSRSSARRRAVRAVGTEPPRGNASPRRGSAASPRWPAAAFKSTRWPPSASHSYRNGLALLCSASLRSSRSTDHHGVLAPGLGHRRGRRRRQRRPPLPLPSVARYAHLALRFVRPESRTLLCFHMPANPYPCNAYQSLGKMQVVLASIFMAH